MPATWSRYCTTNQTVDMTISITNRLSTAVGRLLGDSAEAAGVRPWGWHGLPRRRPLNRTQIVVGSGPFHPVDLERAQGWPRCQFLCSLWRADSKPCLWGHRFRSDQLRRCSAQLSKENITTLEKLNLVQIFNCLWENFLCNRSQIVTTWFHEKNCCIPVPVKVLLMLSLQ